MTYGKVSARLRETMIWLLERRRIIQQLGGPGSYRIPVTSTEADRAVMGTQIQAHRDAVFTYCLHSIRTLTPTAKLSEKQRHREPAVDLRYRAERTDAALRRQPVELSTLLAEPPAYELVGQWQEAARLAVQGEREIGILAHTALTLQQRDTILKDTADLLRGLVALDIRYQNVPGWQNLPDRGRLLDSAEGLATHLNTVHGDPSVDAIGWRPQPRLIEGPALPGMAGVLQAQHNVLADLSRIPTALHLRHVLIGQADLSHQAARLAGAFGSDSAEGFNERADTYKAMVEASRTFGGVLGAGHHAAGESRAAARRMAGVRAAAGQQVGEQLDELAHLSSRVDVKVAAAIEHGFAERLYFTSITLPTIGRVGPGGIARAARKYVPVDNDRPAELLDLARTRLRPPHTPATPCVGSDETHRTALAAAIAAAPGARTRPPR